MCPYSSFGTISADTSHSAMCYDNFRGKWPGWVLEKRSSVASSPPSDLRVLRASTGCCWIELNELANYAAWNCVLPHGLRCWDCSSVCHE